MPLLKPRYIKNQITTLERITIVTFVSMWIVDVFLNIPQFMELILPIGLIISCFKGENIIAQYSKLGFNLLCGLLYLLYNLL